MGDYYHENTPVNEPGLARLVQFADAKSCQWFRLTDYSAKLSENGETLTIHISGEMQNGEKAAREYQRRPQNCEEVGVGRRSRRPAVVDVWRLRLARAVIAR